MPFANIFSHPMGCLLVLSAVFFTVRSFLSWWGPKSSFLLLFPLPIETCLVRSCRSRGQRVCCPVSPTPFAEETVLFPLDGYSFLLCERLVGHTSVGPFLGSLFCSIDLCVCFCASTILSSWLQLLIHLDVQDCDASSFGFLSQDCFWLFRVFSGSVQNLGFFLIALSRKLGFFR